MSQTAVLAPQVTKPVSVAEGAENQENVVAPVAEKAAAEKPAEKEAAAEAPQATADSGSDKVVAPNAATKQEPNAKESDDAKAQDEKKNNTEEEATKEEAKPEAEVIAKEVKWKFMILFFLKKKLIFNFFFHNF